jgi:RHS repeat-associated protein
VQISDPDSSYRYTYDRDGRMETVSNQDTPNVPTTILSYTYDNVGNVLSMTDSINGNLGVTTSHQFDALNRMTQNTQGNKRVDYVYNALSQVTSKRRYSDSAGTNLVAETSHTFDNLNRLTDITHSKGANVLANYTQAYDAKSRITGVTGTDGSSSFIYDNTDQLTGVDYSFQTDESYTYDDNGNRTNAGYVTGVNNRLLEDNKFHYEYDLVGNRTRRTDKLTGEVTNYSWDVRDRLTGLVVRNALGEEVRSAGYTYDVYNQRIAKTVDMDGADVQAATTERYVYGGDQNIDLIFDESGNVSHRYLFGAGVDQIEADESGGSVLWALTDHLGSVRDVVDNAGVVQNHIVYDAFGGVTSQSNASVVFRYGYTARELDAESGLQYNRARYLDSFNGRFISEDPISFAGGDANLYRYARNFPTIFVDPSGYDDTTSDDPLKPVRDAMVVGIGGGLLWLGNGIVNVFTATKEPINPSVIIPTGIGLAQTAGERVGLLEKKKGKTNLSTSQGSQAETESNREPRVAPKPNDCKSCITRELDVHLGTILKNPKGSYYATEVSGSKGDFLIQTPEGLSSYFDGLVRSSGQLHIQHRVTTYKSVIEAKAWDWGDYTDSLKLLKATELINRATHDQIVATRCRYTYSVVISSRSLYDNVKNFIAAPLYIVPFKWGGKFDT